MKTTLLILLALAAGAPTAGAAPVPPAVQEAMAYRARLARSQEDYLATIGQRIAVLEQRAAARGVPPEVVTATQALRPELEDLRRERDDHAFAVRASLLGDKVAMIENAFGG